MSQEVYYRPPSEADSFIIRVMKGCPHNECTFCNMFKGIKCGVPPLEEVIQGMERDAAELGPRHIGLVNSIYLEGGDPIALGTGHLLGIMRSAKSIFPALKRFACYATAKYTVRKTQEELDALSEAGLGTVFVGLESGSDTILAKVRKGCTTEDIKSAALKLARAGIGMDVSMMLGIGGKEFSSEHAIYTARLINAIEPECVRVRTYIPKTGTELGKDYLEGKFGLMGPHDTIRELRLMVLEITARTRLLSEHWTNFILFDARMPEAKGPLLAYIDQYLGVPESEFRGAGLDGGKS